MKFNLDHEYKDIHSYLDSWDIKWSPEDFWYSTNHTELPLYLDEATELFKRNVNKHVGIVVDSDVDGLTSAAIVTGVMRDTDMQYGVYIPSVKSHGLTPEVFGWVIDSDTDFLILFDQASNDVKEIEELLKRGYNILVVDHHNVAPENVETQKRLRDEYPYTYVISNPQIDGVGNVNLTGSGLAYQFALEMGFNHPDFATLAALGQVGDVSDVSDPDIHAVVCNGLSRVSMPLVKQMQGKATTPIDCSFGIISLANGVIRVGTDEEKYDLFKAFMSSVPEDTIVDVTRKRKIDGKFQQVVESTPVYEDFVNRFMKVKDKQKKMVSKAVDSMKIFDNGHLQIGLLNDRTYAPLTGLIANKIMMKEPTLIVSQTDGGGYTGSLRVPSNIRDDEAQWFKNYPDDIGTAGHTRAAGVWFDDIQTVLDLAENDNMFASDPTIDVNLIVSDNNQLTNEFIDGIMDNKMSFGGKVNVPIVALDKVTVKRDTMWQRGSVLLFDAGGITIVKYFCDPDLVMTLPQEVSVTGYGTIGVGELFGKKATRLTLDNVEFNEVRPEEVEEDDWWL
jgi:single-stranded DNA-specific DHH superfamily exonuclease